MSQILRRVSGDKGRDRSASIASLSGGGGAGPGIQVPTDIGLGRPSVSHTASATSTNTGHSTTIEYHSVGTNVHFGAGTPAAQPVGAGDSGWSSATHPAEGRRFSLWGGGASAGDEG